MTWLFWLIDTGSKVRHSWIEHTASRRLGTSLKCKQTGHQFDHEFSEFYEREQMVLEIFRRSPGKPKLSDLQTFLQRLNPFVGVLALLELKFYVKLPSFIVFSSLPMFLLFIDFSFYSCTSSVTTPSTQTFPWHWRSLMGLLFWACSWMYVF